MTNLIVATIYAVVSIGNAVGETWTYFFVLAVALEVAVLALVLRHAWTWPRARPSATTNPQTERLGQLADR